MYIHKIRVLANIFGPLFLLWFLCEFAIYYFVLWRCGYPALRGQDSSAAAAAVGDDDSTIRAMVLADTHLLGTRQGHWFDKLRREWQMHRAFQTAQTYFSPDLVIFLGDVFDEGKWCGPEEFEDYVYRFRDLFHVDPARTEVKVVAGNHDIGFHYAVTPYLNHRFEEAFESKPVEAFSVKGIQFVSVNSMAMEGDGCFLCADAVKRLHTAARQLACLRGEAECELDYDIGGMPAGKDSKPILLQHFPLFRPSDESCASPLEADAAADESERTKPFKEGFDCLSKNSSQFLLGTLNPRLVLSGHTHHGCRIGHGDIPEWSVSSFSWRNRDNPTFLLMTISQSDYAIEKCFMPRESTVIRMYWLGAFAYLVWLLRKRLFSKRLHRR